MVELRTTHIVWLHGYLFRVDRCGPCRYIGPIFEQLAEQHTEAHFVKVDVDVASDIASLCRISAMPTFHFYKGGQKVDDRTVNELLPT